MDRAISPYLRSGPFIAILAVLLLLDCGAAVLAFHTFSEGISLLHWILIFSLHFVLIWIALMNRRLAVIVAVALTLLLVPYQLVLGVRWWRVHQEAARIVAFAEAHRSATGVYPESLEGYRYADSDTRPFVRHYERSRRSPTDYWLSYQIGTPSTSHSYSPRNGWSYYPD